MKLTIPYNFTEMVTPTPPRKPQHVRKTGEITLDIAEVTAADAPVAFIEHRQGRDKTGEEQMPITTEFRWHRERLFTRADSYYQNEKNPCSIEQFRLAPWPFNLKGVNGKEHGCEADSRQLLIDEANDILFVDGIKWKPAAEPRFVIQTFGMGHSHGGTCLFAEPAPPEGSFRLDQREEAIAEATSVATQRGDTNSLPVDRDGDVPTFELLIPEAVRGPILPPREMFTISVTLSVEARGPKLAVRKAASRLGIPDHATKDFTFDVTNQVTGKTAKMKYE